MCCPSWNCRTPFPWWGKHYGVAFLAGSSPDWSELPRLESHPFLGQPASSTGWCKGMRAELPCPNSGPFWKASWAPGSPTPHLAVGWGSCDCITAQNLPPPSPEPSLLPCLYGSWELILIKPPHIHLRALACWWTRPMPALSLALPSSLGQDPPHQSGPVSYHLKTISLPHGMLSSAAVEC